MLSGMDAINLLGAFPNVNALRGVAGKSAVADPSAKVSNQARQAENQDVFLLSPSAQQLSEFFKAQETVDKESGDFATTALKTKGDTLADLLKMQLATFQNSLVQSLQESGVDTTQPIQLQKDNTGNIQVADSHPAAQKIEQVFQKDRGLAQQFREISVLAEIVNTRSVQAKNGDVNGMSPISVISQFMKNSNPGGSNRFQMAIANGKASYHF